MRSFLQFIASNWKEIIALLALILSLVNLWYNFFLKGDPIFACSRWTAVQMLSNQAPRATFAIQISVYNRGKVSLQVYDFVLHAKSDDGQKVTYEPVVLWDLRQWLEDGNRPDKVGRAQKGMVPLPLIVSPGQLYDFSYPILFLPIDKTTLIDPATAKKVTLDLYARTDREEEYQPIGRQDFNADDIRSVLTNTFVSIVSTESSSKRQELLETLK